MHTPIARKWDEGDDWAVQALQARCESVPLQRPRWATGVQLAHGPEIGEHRHGGVVGRRDVLPQILGSSTAKLGGILQASDRSDATQRGSEKSEEGHSPSANDPGNIPR